MLSDSFSEEISEDDDDDYSNKAYNSWRGRSGMIMLIDGRKCMLNKYCQDKNFFRSSLLICREILLSQIKSKDSQHVGIVLFGTKEADDNNSLKNIKTVTKLEKSNIGAINNVKELLENLDKYEQSGSLDMDEPYSLGNALWYCSSIFSTGGVKYYNKSIVLFTSDDNPHSNNAREQQLVRTKGKDLADIGIQVQLIPLGDSFNLSLFYQEFLDLVNKSSGDWIISKPAEDYQSIVKRIHKRAGRGLHSHKLMWNLGNGVSIGVTLNNIYRKVTVPTKEFLDRTTNEPVKSVLQSIHLETGALLLPTDIQYTLNVADEEIVFTPEEKKALQYISEPGLTLLGFKPISSLHREYQCKPSSFIYPEENLVAGSRQLFVALLQRCVSLNKMPVCVITPARNRHPFIVLLEPQIEAEDENGVQTQPSGFHLHYLPFAEYIRNIKNRLKPVNVEYSHVDAAKKLIQALSVDELKLRPNPKLEAHWNSIEALALDYSEPKKFEDLSVPDSNAINFKLRNVLPDFLKSVYPRGYTPEDDTVKTSKKRSAAEPSQSKSKLPKEDFPEYVKKLVDQKKVEILTVYDLKTCLSSFPDIRVPNNCKKATLVELVYKMFR